jgi:hypothetical protein
MTPRAALPLALALGALAAAPAAQASLPKPKSTTIKPGSSIAGIKYGMDAQKALDAWGPGSNCTEASGTQRCTWAGTPKQATAYFEIRDGKVWEVGIQAGVKNGEQSYSGPVAKWKDKYGIGLGSSQFKTAKAWPKAFPNGSGLQLNTKSKATLWGSSSGRNYTIIFGLASNYGR